MTSTARSTVLVALALLPATAVATAQPAADAPRSSARAPQLTADTAAVRPGETLTLQGTGFPPNAHVALLAGPPHAAASRIGGARTGRRGSFVATIRIRAHSAAGAFVALACHDACDVKASARFRILRG